MMLTLKQLPVGGQFKLFGRYRDGQRRPRYRFGPEGVRLFRAYLRLNNHKLGPCVAEITRFPFDSGDLLTVTEQRKGCTIVADSAGRTAPFWSGMTIQQRSK